MAEAITHPPHPTVNDCTNCEMGSPSDVEKRADAEIMRDPRVPRYPNKVKGLSDEDIDRNNAARR